MNENIEIQLSPRIQKHCLKLWQDEYHKHAAREAMVQVEQALKEKGIVKDNRFGKTLIDSLFTVEGKYRTVKLRVPLGDDLQEEAKNYFGSVFAYYRNYLAHDGSKIDKNSALRVLVVASELLDLIDASSLSYADLDGIDGLLKVFDSEDQLLGVLETCDDYALPYHDVDGLREAIFKEYGAVDQHLDAVFDLDLVRCETVRFYEPDYFPGYDLDEAGGWLNLTDLGRKVIDEIRKRKSEGS